MDHFELKMGHESVKALANVLNYLLKVGKELMFEIDSNTMTLRSLKDSRSAFSSVSFDAQNGFFEEYNLNFTPGRRTISLKVPLRPICGIMKNLRSVQSLKIRTDEIKGDRYICFERVVDNGIRRTYRFHYSDTDVLNAAFDEDDTNLLRIQSKQFHDLLSHIHTQSSEISIYATEDTFKVKSHHNKDASSSSSSSSNSLSSLSKHMNTELSIGLDEFEQYEYHNTQKETEMVFCVKEIKGLVALCETPDVGCSDILMYYTVADSPIKFYCENEYFTSTLVLATTAIPKSSGGTTTSPSSSINSNKQQYMPQRQRRPQPEEEEHKEHEFQYTSNTKYLSQSQSQSQTVFTGTGQRRRIRDEDDDDDDDDDK